MITLVSYIDDYTLLFYFGEGGGCSRGASTTFPSGALLPGLVVLGV